MSSPAIIHAVDLQKLKGLLDSGVLDLDEFKAEKALLLSKPTPVAPDPPPLAPMRSPATVDKPGRKEVLHKHPPSTSTTKVIAPKAKMLCAHAA